MDTQTDIVTADGEVITTALVSVEPGQLSELARVEIDQQIATAHRYPRSIKKAVENITTLATLDEATAEECIYALPRGGKPIRGPSVRLAEIIAGQWRNCRVEARTVEINRSEKYVEAIATFHDLETNVAQRTSVRRPIVDRRGRLYNDDMIHVTGQAACSIARRNIILACVPKAVWNRAYQEAERVIKGDVQTLSERRAKAIASFGTWGVKPEQVFAALGVAGEDEVTLEHIPTLRGMFSAIKSGEATVEDLFSGRAPGTRHQGIENPLSDTAPGAGTTPSAGSGFGETSPAAEGAGGSLPPSPAPTATPTPRRHTAAAAAADRASSADGTALKDRDGEAPAGPGPVRAPGEAGEEREDLAGYRRAGFEAGRLGKAKTLPKDLRGDDNAEAADAWLEGHDEGRASQGREG